MMTIRTIPLLARVLAAILPMLAAPALADSANPLSSEPAQPIEPGPPMGQGPIVGGSRIQPRADQTVSGGGRLSDDPQLKALYEGVLRDSDPSTYRRNREPTAH